MGPKSVGMTDPLFPPQPRGRALAPPQDPLSQGSGDTYLQGPDFLPPGKQEQVDRDQFQELQRPHQFVVDMVGRAGSPRVRGHLLRQVELKRGPCVQELLGPAGESGLPADPELALSCPLQVETDEVFEEGLKRVLVGARGLGPAHGVCEGLDADQSPVAA